MADLRNGVERVFNASARIQVDRYMAQETARALDGIRAGSLDAPSTTAAPTPEVPKL